MHNDRITLSQEEINKILSKVPKIYHLEIYRALKTNFLSTKATKADIKFLQDEIVRYLKQKDAPRVLYDNELDEILEAVTLIPSTIKDISVDNNKQLKKMLRYQFSKLKFSIKEGTVQRLKQIVRRQFLQSICSAGESVGIKSSTSLSQKITQGTLNTFHQAGSGSANNQGGIEYLKRFLLVSKPKEDKFVIHFKDKNLTHEEIKMISNNLKGVNIDHVKLKYEIMDTLPEKDKIWYDNYLTITGTNFIYKGGKFLRIYLNLNLCYRYNIFINDVVKTIEMNTKSSEIKQTVKCIASSTFEGIIDVHVETEFIKLYIAKQNQKIGKNVIPFSSNIEDLSQIFLNVLLPENFKEMIIKGIKGIEHISISEGINLIRSFTETPITSSVDLEKYSQEPYNLKLDEIGRLWRIKIQKIYLFFEGLNEDKYVKLFEEAGFEIIENRINTEDMDLVVLLPYKLDIKYFDSKDKKIKPLYSMDSYGIIYDNKKEEIVTNITPVTIIEGKIKFIESQLANLIDENIKNASKMKTADLPIFPPLYRYCYYYHTVVQGKGINNDLMSNNTIDSTFTYPDNVNSVYEHLGVEAARFYLINKYFQTPIAGGLNPVNPDLLVDFQTGLGILLPINSTGVNKIGSSVLSSCSYEKSMDIFQEGSAFGSVDEIKGISGCIMTGTNCHNGTGSAMIEYSQEYLKNKNNLHKQEAVKDIKLEVDYLVGSCYKTAPQDMYLDFGGNDMENNVLMNINEQPKVSSQLCPKDKIPDPPRMVMPEFLRGMLEESIIDVEADYSMPDKYISMELLDIPDDPGQIMSDYF